MFLEQRDELDIRVVQIHPLQRSQFSQREQAAQVGFLCRNILRHRRHTKRDASPMDEKPRPAKQDLLPGHRKPLRNFRLAAQEMDKGFLV